MNSFSHSNEAISEKTNETNLYDVHFKQAADPKTMEQFWKEQAKLVSWYKPPNTILHQSEPPFYRWFTDGEMNTCYNCVDRHLEERGNQPALIYESPMTKSSKVYTFNQLKEYVAKFAGVLAHHGVEKGDRVIIYMPMVPEALIATLACARLGAIHSIVFGGFAAKELASRILDAEPKVVVSASCGIEPHKVVNYKQMLDEAVKIAKMPNIKRIILRREQLKVDLIKGVDFDFYEELEKAHEVEPVPVLGSDPLYILYTSGTTGTPKGIVRDNGGNAVALMYSMKYIFGIKPGDIYFSTSDIGWVVGHSYIIYGPLLTGATTIVFEGKPTTPDSGIIWRTAEKYKVRGIYTSPTAMRSVIKEDPQGKHVREADLSSLTSFSMAGERLDIPTANWLLDHLPKTCLLNDNYWQTETGWSIGTNFVNLHTFKVKPGSTTKPAPGYRVAIVDEETGHHLPPGKMGNVVIQLPMPPSFMTTLYKNDKAFVAKYFTQAPCYYFTGDAGFFDEEGYLQITSRVDDIINTAGHRLSTSQMEEVLTGHEDIVEAAVLAAKEDFRGEIPVGFVVLKSGVDRDRSEIVKELILKIREDIGPVACFRHCMIVDKLPKTRSGKILRNVLRAIVDGEKPKVPPTIEDESVLEAIKKEAKKLGFCQEGTMENGESQQNQV